MIPKQIHRLCIYGIGGPAKRISETLAIYLILMIKLERLHESLANPVVFLKFSKGESQKFLMSLHVAVGWGASPQSNK